MKKFLVVLLVLCLLAPSAFASVGFKKAGAVPNQVADIDCYPTSACSVSGSTGKIDGRIAAITSGSIAGASGSFTTLASSSDFAVNTNKFTVTASTGATSVGGALTLTATGVGPGTGWVHYSLRTRVTVAQLNAGQTLLAALTNYKYRIENVKVIAYGGALSSTNATHVEVRGTQSSSVVALFKVAKAQLGQSVLNTFGTASTILLNDGASTATCDQNAAITVNALGGSDFAGATGIDVILDYVVES
jgi:hypothetical protein